IERASLRLETTALAADDEEHLAGLVQCVVPELEVIAALHGKQPLVDGADVRPAAHDAAERIGHPRVGRGAPVLLHQLQVARGERVVELAQRGEGLGEIAERVLAVDRCLGGAGGGEHGGLPYLPRVTLTVVARTKYYAGGVLQEASFLGGACPFGKP